MFGVMFGTFVAPATSASVPPMSSSAPAAPPPRAPEDRGEAASIPVAGSGSDGATRDFAERRFESPPIVFRRIADRLSDLAIASISTEVGVASDVELAFEALLHAAAIDPENADRWRFLLQVADLIDRRDVSARALVEIVRLDPTDEVARLRRLVDAIGQKQTAEEQVAAYQELLKPAQVRQLGPAVASRLATDLALLLQRMGDADGYAAWIAEAVALDPSNPGAVDELAGFFEFSAGDATAVAELMVARCLAQPTNVAALDRFGQFLLGRGASAAASRVFELLVELGGGLRAAPSDVIGQLVLAQWMNGQLDAATRVLDIRQRDADDEIRRRLEFLRVSREQGRAEDAILRELIVGLPPGSALEFGRIASDSTIPLTVERSRSASAPLPRVLAAARVAMAQITGSPTAPEATREFSRSVQMGSVVRQQAASIDSEREAESIDPVTLAEALLDDAWWLLFLGDDLPAARGVIEMARGFSEIAPANAPLVEGWLRLREGDMDAAATILDRLVESDDRARVGRAILLLSRSVVAGAGPESGSARARAAADLLAVARSNGATLLGVWSYERLVQLLGARPPLWPDVAQIEAMAATLPTTFDRLLLQAQRHLILNVRPTSLVFGAFDRPEAIVTLDNRSAFPLAISTAGPISPMIAIPVEVTRYGTETGSGAMPVPALVDIGRRISLAPGERMELRVDLGSASVFTGRTLGSYIRDLSLSGTSILLRGRALLNPAAATQATREKRLTTGVMGSESPPIEFRVTAIPFESGWREAAVEAVTVVDRPEELEMLATMTFRLAQLNDERLAALGPEQRQQVQAAAEQQTKAVLAALPQLDAAGIAFVAMHMAPGRPLLAGIERAIREERDPLVRLVALASLVGSADDPLLDETRRGDDPELRRLAELLAARFSAMAASAER